MVSFRVKAEDINGIRHSKVVEAESTSSAQAQAMAWWHNSGISILRVNTIKKVKGDSPGVDRSDLSNLFGGTARVSGQRQPRARADDLADPTTAEPWTTL